MSKHFTKVLFKLDFFLIRKFEFMQLVLFNELVNHNNCPLDCLIDTEMIRLETFVISENRK